jgi:hypothetical protein
MEKLYKTFISLSQEEKKRFEYICKEENRNKTDMIKFFIAYHFKRLQGEKEKEVVIEKPTPTNEDYQKFLNLWGIGWDGDLDAMRETREFN